MVLFSINRHLLGAAHGRKRKGRLGLAVLVLVLGVLSCRVSAYARGDVNRGECSPETEATVGFSSSLPDCRAYELVSPVYGGGTRIGGPEGAGLSISSNGEHVLGEAFAAFGGAESLEFQGREYGDVYEFSRTSGGWSAEALDPPQSLYPFHEFERASALEPGRSVWAVPGPLPAGAPAEPNWFRLNNGEYVLREGHGAFVAIGPVTAPGHEEREGAEAGRVMGISSDLAHIVFEVQAQFKQLWPGDTTAEASHRGSLYEYHGTDGGEPVLVGVMNSGRAPWRAGAPHVNEGAQLASECGTVYNGMSASGERVFFTAQHQPGCVGSQPPVDELFARVGGSETVAISEPSKADCEACDTEGVPGEARFAGASEDGSIVYFTSEQELLPGAHGDSLYEFDFNAAPPNRVALVAPNTAQGARVSSDGVRIYFEASGVLPGATNENGSGEVAADGRSNLYVYDAEAGTVSFVADGEGAGGFDTTADGEYLAFSSRAKLAEANGETTDTSAVPQLFEYDAANGVVVRVSKGQHSSGGYWCPATGALEGFDCEGNTGIAEDTPHLAREANSVDGMGLEADEFTPPRSVDEHGAVVFTSELRLTPGAVQGGVYYKEEGEIAARSENVYEFREGQVYLISPAAEATALGYEGNGAQQGPLVGIDESGRDIFFTSVERLLPQVGSTQSSWYDAREDGGFLPASTPDGCGEEDCQGAAGTLSVSPAPAADGGSLDPSVAAALASPPSSTVRGTVRRACRGGSSHRTRKRKCDDARKPKKTAKKVYGGRK